MTFRFDLFPVIAADDNPRANGKVFQLLKAVRETGSLHRAAQEIGLSYRHAWGVMRTWEDMLGRSMLDMERGRGASLTRFGERLLRAELRLRETIDPAVQKAMADFLVELDDAAQPQTVVHFSGSHDPAVETLTAALKGAPTPLQLDAVFCGSVEGLICLQERQSELAGFYVSPIQVAGSVAHVTLRKWLRPATVRLVRLAWREQGLIVAPDMAREIHDLRDLARTGARFVNRQRSSGTRMLFDQLLATHGLYPDQITGYEDPEFSNEKVAQAVRSGRAQVGFGLRMNAEANGLAFVPLTREAYYLAVRKNDQTAPWMLSLLALLADPAFAQRIEALPGYTAAEPAGILTPQQALPWFGTDGKEGA
ncbi:transcriptional regulator of molybdate metabolism, LysR family [Cupriavidus sp. YR651]|uniref:substrate-binding domain-containing protein n=1 Tax=Cupriavidus sp. YR651 TaxID=1855315 RepID=UPI000889BDB9|nr:substrate-binding domain-containing protein [Cupriavidus sp. YR651]SDD27131.1 transcriptional regulator of molybdate metabolism, LysR family [Cupriavidus sp. YR651]